MINIQTESLGKTHTENRSANKTPENTFRHLLTAGPILEKYSDCSSDVWTKPSKILELYQHGLVSLSL